jgi:hypothetical protein
MTSGIDARHLIEPTTNGQRLTTALKERLQHFGASACENAAPDLHSVVQLRMIQHLHHGPNCASLGIVRAVNQALDAGVGQSPGTHCARFNCSKELAVGQSVITHGGTSITQRHNLSMRRGIAVADVAIPSLACDAPVTYHDCTHWNFARFQSALGATQSFLHKKFIVLGRGVPRFLAELRSSL